MNFTDLPAVNACLNGLATVLLAAGFICIKRGNKIAHRNRMIAALVTSTAFLVCYLTYHYKMKQAAVPRTPGFSIQRGFGPFISRSWSRICSVRLPSCRWSS